MNIQVRALAVTRGPVTVLECVTATFEPGSLTVLAGPNGAGKSTLLDAIAGDLAVSAGEVLFGDLSLAAIPLIEKARLRAMLPQRATIAFDFAVRDVVAMGLHPHGLSPKQPAACAMVDSALADMELLAHADRPATRLSGGEQQRVHIARCLVQVRAALAEGLQPLMLLDEPTTGLDYRHQFALAASLRKLARAGATVIVSLHDLLLARTLADTILLLGNGRLIASGPPAAILSPPAVANLYGLDLPTAAGLLGFSAGQTGAPECAHSHAGRDVAQPFKPAPASAWGSA